MTDAAIPRWKPSASTAFLAAGIALLVVAFDAFRSWPGGWWFFFLVEAGIALTAGIALVVRDRDRITELLEEIEDLSER